MATICVSRSATRPVLSSEKRKHVRSPVTGVPVQFEFVDEANFLEIHAAWAKNIVCGFARFGSSKVNCLMWE